MFVCYTDLWSKILFEKKNWFGFHHVHMKNFLFEKNLFLFDSLGNRNLKKQILGRVLCYNKKSVSIQSWQQLLNYKFQSFFCLTVFCIIRKRVALVIPRLKTERHVESSLIQKHFKLPKLKFIYARKLSDILNRNFLRHI